MSAEQDDICNKCDHEYRSHHPSGSWCYICGGCDGFSATFVNEERPAPKPVARPKPAAPTFNHPEHITRDVRKFALSQAVKYASIGGYTGNAPILDFAAKFEDYVMNGKKENK